MVRFLRITAFWSIGLLATLCLLQLSSCAQVEQLKTDVTEKMAFDAGSKALAEGDRAAAKIHFRKAADQHDASAMNFWGAMHARGEGAARAIRAFQNDVGMPVDGKVSDALMRRIDERRTRK